MRYCNLECSHAHLRHGGGFKFPARGAAEDPHEHTCKRTYGRSGKLFYMLNRTLAPRGGVRLHAQGGGGETQAHMQQDAFALLARDRNEVTVELD